VLIVFGVVLISTHVDVQRTWTDAACGAGKGGCVEVNAAPLYLMEPACRMCATGDE
jgi:hypothetical protein